MFLVFKVSVNIFKPWRPWEFSICSFNILSNIIYAIYSKDIFKNLKWNWDIFLVFVAWRKPKSTTGTSTRDILWMDLLRVRFIQARNTIIFKGIFRLVGRSRFFPSKHLSDMRLIYVRRHEIENLWLGNPKI